MAIREAIFNNLITVGSLRVPDLTLGNVAPVIDISFCSCDGKRDKSEFGSLHSLGSGL